MSRTVRYLSHPQVLIDPARDVRNWSLNDEGRRRVNALAQSAALNGTTMVISSAETKAVETATPLARALRCDMIIRDLMHENDRSSTGFLPPDEFERVADRFFAFPDDSVRGWETARAAQTRIVAEVTQCLRDVTGGDVLFVGHGGVGTLLYCHIAGLPISRDHDHPPGGGCFFTVSDDPGKACHPWRPMEEMQSGF
ncbi:MAG: histidine phosphatase family protein [Rhodobacteraceae bacterium]|nr:histidine phosphatase family protein [Paracoccaceae bacterium]